MPCQEVPGDCVSAAGVSWPASLSASRAPVPGGGQEGDGHAVPPSLPVSPRLGQDQQRVGAAVGLK